MRVAVFTNEFPSRVSTFFARDMRALLEEGLDLEIFPVAPLQSHLWRDVPDILNERVLPRRKVHHIGMGAALSSPRNWPGPKAVGRFVSESAAICASAARFGLAPLLKTAYVLPKALAWAGRWGGACDHVLAYWGNYAGTCAYLFHRLVGQAIPFSLFLHAGVDLYRDQVYLRQKLLYADRIIVTCEFNRDFLRELYPDIFPLIAERTHIHHIPVDLTELPYLPDGRPRLRVIGVGRLDRRKGFDDLLRAAAALRERGMPVEVELVGDGEQRDSLGRLVGALGIASHVRFHGWLPFDQVRVVMGDATVLVHPSTGLGDAVPNVIKEAMALGTPVVASGIAGIPELLDHGEAGLLVPPRDVRALTAAIERLLKDEGLRRRFAEAGRRHVERRYDLRRNGQLAELIRKSTRKDGDRAAAAEPDSEGQRAAALRWRP